MARQPGQPNSKTLQATTALVEKGCDPLAILADIAMGNVFKKKNGEEMEPSLDMIKDAAKELCQYIYPKRKAVEHTGPDDEPIFGNLKIEWVAPSDYKASA